MKNINFEKVLEIIEKGDFKDIQKKQKRVAFVESSYFDITLKEGGVIRLEQFDHVFNKHFEYRIYLFVPMIDTSIESWTIDCKKRPILYERINNIFYKLYQQLIEERDKEYSRYFPQ